MSHRYPQIFALVLATLVVSSAFATEGGGGHNGPLLSGPSIDLTLDRELMRSEMNPILKRCLADAVAETAVAIAGDANASFPLTSQFTFSTDSDIQLGSVGGRVGKFTNENPSIGFSLLGRQWISCRKPRDPCPLKHQVRLSSVDLKLELYNFAGLTRTTDLVVSDFPFIRFAISKDGKYDRAKNPIPGSETVTRVEVFQDPTRERYPLLNAQSLVQTDYSINGAKYVDCVRASL